MQAYRDMTVYPETDDEADRNRREISRGSPCRACNNKVNGVGGLHSGLQGRAQVICCGATNTVASQGTLLPSLIAVPAGYFFVASPPASHQDTSSDSVHAAEAVSVHYTCRPACTCWPQRTQNVEWPFARLSVTPASRPAGRTPFTFPAGLKLATFPFCLIIHKNQSRPRVLAQDQVRQKQLGERLRLWLSSSGSTRNPVLAPPAQAVAGKCLAKNSRMSTISRKH